MEYRPTLFSPERPVAVRHYVEDSLNYRVRWASRSVGWHRNHGAGHRPY